MTEFVAEPLWAVGRMASSRFDVVRVQLGVAPSTVPAWRVDIRVADPAGATMLLSGYRMEYDGQVLH